MSGVKYYTEVFVVVTNAGVTRRSIIPTLKREYATLVCYGAGVKNQGRSDERMVAMEDQWCIGFSGTDVVVMEEQRKSIGVVGGVNVAQMRDYVTIDWDVPFGESMSVDDVMKDFAYSWKSVVRRAWIRPSGNGNTHVLIEFCSELSVIQRFAFRGLMHDDPLRLLWDTHRCASSEKYFKSRFADDLTDYSHGVLFDVKDGKEAGPWSHVAIS